MSVRELQGGSSWRFSARLPVQWEHDRTLSNRVEQLNGVVQAAEIRCPSGRGWVASPAIVTGEARRLSQRLAGARILRGGAPLADGSSACGARRGRLRGPARG